MGWTHTQLNDYSSIWVNNWLVVSTRLKNMKVSWDDEIPNIWKIKFRFQSTNQISYSSLQLGHVVIFAGLGSPREDL